MSTQTRIEFISDGFKAILQGDGVKQAVTEAAQEIQQKANANVAEGEGFSCNTWMGAYGGGRWVASVTTTDKASRKAESEDKALSRAVT